VPVAFTIKKSRFKARASKFGASFSLAASIAFGLMLFTTTDIARQDASSMIAGNGDWANFIERSPAGSTHVASMAFGIDPITTGSNVPFGAQISGVGPKRLMPVRFCSARQA
jgi:hypothetical protein